MADPPARNTQVDIGELSAAPWRPSGVPQPPMEEPPEQAKPRGARRQKRGSVAQAAVNRGSLAFADGYQDDKAKASLPRRVYDLVKRWEARNHKRLQGLPHTLPMMGAVICILLMSLPSSQNPMNSPAIFQWSILFTLLALFGWIFVGMANDCSHNRYSLLQPQRPRTVLLILFFGCLLAVARLIHIFFGDVQFVASQGDYAVATAAEAEAAAARSGDMDRARTAGSTEHLQRLLIGLPYYIFGKLGIDMGGLATGFLLFNVFIFGGCFAMCVFNCCGRVRFVQSIFRRRRDAMPFMDMVGNRFTLSSFNALLFLFPFCILSTFVIGGNLLIEPTRSFARANPPHTMRMLCSPVVTTNLFGLASNAIKELSGRFLPASVATNGQAEAIGVWQGWQISATRLR